MPVQPLKYQCDTCGTASTYLHLGWQVWDTQASKALVLCGLHAIRPREVSQGAVIETPNPTALYWPAMEGSPSSSS